MFDVAIINYEMGNLRSILSACEAVGLKATITDNPKIIKKSKSIILPGVGAFNQAIKNIKKKKLFRVILDFYYSRKPVIGICLGMQILFEESEENLNTKGFGIIKGAVREFNYRNKNNVINIGWRKIKVKKFKNTYLDILNNKKFYFIHKFICVPNDKNIILAHSNYFNKKFCAAVKYQNVEAYQFHPEKSGINGIKIYKNLKKKIMI
tara:strand:+ start:1403 stop:2026 length:624 start_codon:yes stop_codon:yes gene_type:complete